MHNRTCESEILDYKESLIEDSKILKQVSAFANTQGGYLVFGIRETGRGGYPEEILGIDNTQINTERIEQIILGSIQPRLNVKIKRIDMDSTKSILVIEIPNSYLKPHMNSEDKRFYKRYQFEASPMTEMEVNDAYRRRYVGYEEVEKYLSPLLDEAKKEAHYLMGQIIVIPTIIGHLIDTNNPNEFDWLKQIDFQPNHNPSRVYPVAKMKPSSAGIECQIDDNSNTGFQKLEIHRNGCLNYKAYFQWEYNGRKYLKSPLFCIRLLHTFQLASSVYQKYNFFGDVKILCQLQPLDNSWLPDGKANREQPASQRNTILTSREFSTRTVDSKQEWISSEIMNEIYNSYGEWNCPYFDDEGTLKKDWLKPN